MSRLTPKQEKFCTEYIQSGNASEAYKQAYSAGRMKAETINRSAFETLQNPKITTRVKELQFEIATEAKITAVEGATNYRKLITYGMTYLEDEMRDPELARRSTDSLMKLGGLLREGATVNIANVAPVMITVTFVSPPPVIAALKAD